MTRSEMLEVLKDADFKRGRILQKRNAMMKSKECTPEEACRKVAGELSECNQRQKDAIIQFFAQEYKLAPAAMELIYKRAYEEGHAFGSLEVVRCAEDLAELVADICKVS